MEACELLAVEVRLDRIEAELARELPPHVRAFAHAHAHGLPAPPAPDLLRHPATLATARAALAHPVLADRGLALLRLVAPIAIEADPGVRTASAAPPSWTALSTLAAARDAAATALFGRRAIDLIHRLHGSGVDLAELLCAGAASPGPDAVESTARDADTHRPAASRSQAGPRDRDGVTAELPPAIAGWFEPDGIVVDGPALARTWDAIGTCHGLGGSLRFERSAAARPRAFVVDPLREVIIAIPARIATPAERFTVLHELGHAIAAFALPAGIPRVLDEAVAAYVARAIEREADAWYSPLAAAARGRRRALAHVLDHIERALPQLPAPDARPAEHPPSPLWHDPGSQAAYVAAERLADALDDRLGPSPAPGALVAEVSALRDTIDRIGAVSHAI